MILKYSQLYNNLKIIENIHIMSDIITVPQEISFKDFVETSVDEKRKEDTYKINSIIEEITGWKPVVWRGGMIGYGNYRYSSPSGQTGLWPITGFRAAKAKFTIYIMPGFEIYPKLMQKLGKHKLGKSCLYINKMSDVDENVLKELIQESVETMKQRYTVNPT